MAGGIAENYPKWASSMGAMKAQTPDIAAGFGGMFKTLMKDGALDIKQKELIALGIALSQRCEPCIWSHTEKCVKAGATHEELADVCAVAVTMGGGPVYTYVPKVLEASEYFRSKVAAG
jgi:AhpD family alkylhydroperoxidase